MGRCDCEDPATGADWQEDRLAVIDQIGQCRFRARRLTSLVVVPTPSRLMTPAGDVVNDLPVDVVSGFVFVRARGPGAGHDRA